MNYSPPRAELQLIRVNRKLLLELIENRELREIRENRRFLKLQPTGTRRDD